MVKRMLVDATHAEETRVVVVSGNKLEEFDFESASKKQLKGNIYLAKVTRVEPSLQAAFIEYGGNRHGFLAFSEIHPDYYRIPVADREALLAAEHGGRRADEDGADARHDDRRGRSAALDDPFRDPRDEDGDDDAHAGDARETAAGNPDDAESAPERIETVGGDDVDEAQEIVPPSRPRRSYKIQEVIKRRQIMLVQVTKEERGNKGAALTTFLSLAGRYCVLMPNTPRGGGISRKIANPKDRKKMKAILDDLFIPEGMAVILRTAGMERTKAEIKRDLDYLLRLWDSIRELTLQSTAPTLIHEEANLIKRAERDLYNKDIEEILVAGEDGYRSAKDFMRMLMPSHAKKVQLYKDPTIPLFHRYQVESQIDAMHSQVVQLRSGGYVVINPTEALVSIDVNSGRSTRERNIEETAYKTNLEAAEEIARQLRLRDLAGLIVIDFIDMEDDRHNGSVERKLKECMRQDRARIQLGRISPFGLLELSRQRLRPSLTENHFEVCRICGGTGLTRSLSSAALHVLRAIEEEGIRKRSGEVKVYVSTEIALYILNDKRDSLAEIEQRYGFSVLLGRDDDLISPSFRMEQVRGRGEETVAISAPAVDSAKVLAALDEDRDEDLAEDEEQVEGERPAAAADGEDSDRKRRRRPRRGRRRRGEPGDEHRAQPATAGTAEVEAVDEDAEDHDGHEEPDEHEDHDEERAAGDDDHHRRKRRRGKRGGRRRSTRPHEDGAEVTAEDAEADETMAADQAAEPAETAAEEPIEATVAEPVAPVSEPSPEPVPDAPSLPAETEPAADAAPAAVEEKPKRKRAPRRRKTVEAEPAAEAEVAAAAAPAGEEVETAQPSVPEPAPAGGNGHDESAAPAEDTPEDNAAAREATVINQMPEKPRRGWWRRLTSG